jgi:hypothetical protein
VEIGCKEVEMGQLQPSLCGGLGLQYALEFSFEMGDLEAEV